MSQGTQNAEFTTFDASGWRVGIVVAQFNRDICEALLKSAREMLSNYHVHEQNITVVRVAGSVEIPVVLQALAATKDYQCLLALGAVIRGETPHFDYVANMASEGVLRVMLDAKLPIGFGVLTCDNLEQARARLHVGGGAAEAALQAAKAIEKMK